MRLQTPQIITPVFYAGIDTRAKIDDEFLGLSFGRFYVGIYPTDIGFDIACGILNSQGTL